MQGPILNNTKTHLQRSLGDDNILVVKFLEDGSSMAGKIFEEGIIVGLRRYRFFGDYSSHFLDCLCSICF